MKKKLSFILLFLIIFYSCNKNFIQLKSSKNYLYQIDTSQVSDNEILNFYKPQKNKLDSFMNDVVAISDFEIEKQLPEGPLNNFFADAMIFASKQLNINCDIAYTNFDGLRISLPKGNIYRYKIFELMPFENKLVTIRINGKQLKVFLNAIAKLGGSSISGANFTIKNEEAIDISIKNKTLELDKEYTILTSDYIANGGDIGETLTNGFRVDSEILLRDALFIYLKNEFNNSRTLSPKKDGRIKVE